MEGRETFHPVVAHPGYVTCRAMSLLPARLETSKTGCAFGDNLLLCETGYRTVASRILIVDQRHLRHCIKTCDMTPSWCSASGWLLMLFNYSIRFLISNFIFLCSRYFILQYKNFLRENQSLKFHVHLEKIYFWKFYILFYVLLICVVLITFCSVSIVLQFTRR